MTRVAAVVVGVAGHARRIAQVRDLLGTLGLAVDLVVVGGDGDQVGSGWRRIGFLPGDAGDELGAFLDALNDGARYAICHLHGVALPASLADVRTAEASWTGEAEADLWFASDEAERAACADLGRRAVRLPVRAVRPGPAVDGVMFGWSGDWPPERREDVTAILDELARAGADPAGGIVLAGPGADGVVVPDNLARHVLVLERCVPPATPGLGLAPGPLSPADHRTIADLVGMGRPVLIDAAAAGAFEGRWRLPVADGPAGFAALVGHWVADRSAFRTPMAATQRTFARDLEAMTRHVAEELAAMIGGVAS